MKASAGYKSQMIDDIYKEVIAFANTDGGVIYLGIDDKGDLIGIDDVDETYTRLTNGIRDAIAPDVTMFVRYVLQKVIQIEVAEQIKSCSVFLGINVTMIGRDPTATACWTIFTVSCRNRRTVSTQQILRRGIQGQAEAEAHQIRQRSISSPVGR